MLSKLKSLFLSELEPGTQIELDASQRQLACAALLIEVAVIDNEFDERELKILLNILEHSFDIPSSEIDNLITLAHNECSEATSMYQFTKLVNLHCTNDDKFDLMVQMWRVAFADGDLDKYEEYIIRKVSDLIYLGHGDFIRAKHTARKMYAET